MTFDFFSEFNKLSDEYLPKISKIHQHKTSFCKAFEDLLQLHPKELSWPELFNSRMVTFQNVIEPRLIDGYVRLTRAYNEIRGENEKKKPLKKRDAENYAAARDLLSFLQLHRMDPDNSLLGLSPSHQILEKHCKRIADAFANIGGTTTPLAPSDLKAESLILRIMNWSEIDDSAKIAEGVRQFAYQLLTNLQIGVGDVVLCRIPPPRTSSSTAEDASSAAVDDPSSTNSTHDSLTMSHSDEPSSEAPMLAAASSLSNAKAASRGGDWAYCRVYRVLPTSVVVHNNPLESKTVGVPTSNVIPLDASLRSALGNAKNMQTLVQQPLDLLYDELRAMIADRFVEILRENNVDERLCDPSAKLSLRDFPKIRTGLQNLTVWNEQRFSATIDELEAQGTRYVKDFIARLRPEKLFSPMREQTFRSLRSPPIREFAQKHIQAAVSVADENFINWESMRKTVLNGVKKRELTEWYLDHIENSVDEWLKTTHGFDFDAIPPNYLEHPPRGGHLHHVRDNVFIIEQVKSMDNAKFSPLQLMSSLRSEVYVKIDEFLDNLCVIISEKLNLAVDFGNIRTICSGIMDESIKLDQDDPETAWICECMKDVDYILEMKDCEEITFTKKKLQLSRVVPITGLIFSRFLRIENELMTVLDVWAHLDRVQPKATEEKPADINTMHSAFGLGSLSQNDRTDKKNKSADSNTSSAAPTSSASSTAPPTPTTPTPEKDDEKKGGGAHGILSLIKRGVGDRKSTAIFRREDKPAKLIGGGTPQGLDFLSDGDDSHDSLASSPPLEKPVPTAAPTPSTTESLTPPPPPPEQIIGGEEPAPLVLGRRPSASPRGAPQRPAPPGRTPANRLSGNASRTQSYSSFSSLCPTPPPRASSVTTIPVSPSSPPLTSNPAGFCDPSSSGTAPAEIPIVAATAPEHLGSDGTAPDSFAISVPPR